MMKVLSAVVVAIGQTISDRENDDEFKFVSCCGDRLSAGEGEHGCS